MTDKLPRDVFWEKVYEYAKNDKDVYIVDGDLGAKALDEFRENIPGQFIHSGIMEQAMMNVASGMASCGKKIFLYAMAPFITFRAYEQIKVTLATMNLPVTLVGVGVGYGYDGAGPTHYATEDISVMRALGNIEILSPSDTKGVLETVKLCYEKPKLRYIRLDRKFLPNIYSENDSSFFENGVSEIVKGNDVCIITNGFMTQKALMVREKLEMQGISSGVVDIFKIKPMNSKVLKNIVENYKRVVVLEEHFLSGGIGSIIAETFIDEGVTRPTLRIGINDEYHFANNLKESREHLLKLAKIDVDSVVNRVIEYVRK